MKNKRYLFILMLFSLFFCYENVDARAYAPAPDTFHYNYLNDGAFCFDEGTGSIRGRQNGGNCSPMGAELAKYANFGGQDNAIYCAEWDKNIDVGATFKRYSSSKWNVKSERAVVAGAISYNLNGNNDLSRDTYARVGVAINHYLATSGMPLPGSHRFWNLRGEYVNAINNAVNYYNNVKSELSATKLKSAKFSVKSPQLSGSGNTYKSGTITVSDLVTTQYGKPVNYHLKVTTNNTAAKVRVGNSGDYATSIDRDITSTIANGKYSFILYVQGTDIADTRVTMNVSSSSSKDYYTSYLYYSTRSEGSTQRLIYPGIITVNRTSSNSINTIVPDMNQYDLYIHKENEDGELLKDASFKLAYNNSQKTLNIKNGTYYWKSGPTTDTYDFSKFTLTEITAPDGYIYEGDAITFNNVTPGTTCVDENNEEVDDVNLCHPENYSYMCVDETTGEKSEPDDNGNCGTNEAVTPENPTGGDNNGGNNSGEGSGEGSDEGSGSEGGETPSEPPHTYTKKCRAVNTTTEVSDFYCNSSGKYTLFQLNGKNLTVTVTNKRNSVIISKKSITGDDEVPGATLKICTASNYANKKEDCDVVKNVDDVELTWVSTSTPQMIRGLKPGKYVIVETIAPNGYIEQSQGTAFKLDADGKVTGDTVKSVEVDGGHEDRVIVNNKPTSMTISKTDVATTKELPGAKLSICRASSSEANEKVVEKGEYLDKKVVINKFTGECIPVVLADGTRAEWISTDQPKEIIGLPAGTYYLVEKQAPKGYSKAESIKFVMKKDGTLTDEKGHSLAANKLVMHDNVIKVPNTYLGMPLYLALTGAGLIVVGLGGYIYVRRKHYV